MKLLMSSTSQDRVPQGPSPGILSVASGRRVPLHILFVHTDATKVADCLGELRRARLNVSEDVATTPEQFAGFLKSKAYDLVLVEYPPVNWNGTQVLETLRTRDRPIPCVHLTDTSEPETEAELISRGASDCVAMDNVGHIPVAVRRALSESKLREERQRAEKKLRHSEARYRALVGNLAYGMCRCGTKGRFLDVNQALVTMLGFQTREQLLAVNLAAEILADPSRRAQLLGRSTDLDHTDPLEIEWKRKDGAALKVRLSGREVSHAGRTNSYEIIVEDVTQQRKLEAHLRQQAAKDPLTGLANYRHLVDTVNLEIRRSERTARPFAVLFLDLDGLKQINDGFGHLVGSQALCRLADVLSLCSRDIDTSARFGGDEFALVLPETERAAAASVARRIRNHLAHDAREPKLSVSIGIAVYPEDGRTIDALLGAADKALYSVKANARTRKAGMAKHRSTVGVPAKRPIATKEP
jgi:diguanylate cyclase (GGDEF)-like protein/PAS domain S-box-containing protein